ncbi:MAG TPA: hypothetical protein VIF57_12505 [Polyangia bacterium]|jgi:hypothetical protein
MTRSVATSLWLLAVAGCASSPPPAPAASTPAPAPAAAPASAPAAVAAPAAPVPVPAPAKPRTPDEILADAVKATGGADAWNAHKTVHCKIETTLKGMGMGGAGDHYQTRADKALTILDMTGLGKVREGTNGKVAWSDDPLQGIRYLDGAEAEQARIGASWNLDMHAAELFVKLETASEPGPDGAALECVVATPKLGSPWRTCYDPRTHLQVTQSGTRVTPQGEMPFRATISQWRDISGVKIPTETSTQMGPITTSDRVTQVTFDEPMDDKMFDPPKPAQSSDDKKSNDKKPKKK